MKRIFTIAFVFIFGLGIFLGPISTVFAEGSSTDPVTPAELATGQDYTQRLQTCVFADGNGTFAGCMVQGFYYLILYPSGKFAQLTARLLDFFIAYSIDSNSYGGGNGQFVTKGWGVIRDIANVFFIFTLLYIAIRHILQMGSSDTKKLLTSLIIAALLINFSLFFSKVIIDGGNVLARVFWNNIEVVNDDHPDGENVHSISQALVSKINPQKILGSDLFTPDQQPGQPLGTMTIGYSFFVMAIAAFVNITIGVVFLSTFLLFVARVIGLWFLMIFSPIAFASFALPGGGSFLGQFGWSGWRDNILKLSFMAPVFLFFLFLTVMFLQIILSTPIVEEDTTHKLMAVLIPFIAVIVILQRAKSVASDMAGEFGKSLTSAVGKMVGGALAVGGVVGGAAMGASAFGMRYFVGGSASRELKSGVHQENVRLNNQRAEDAQAKADAARQAGEHKKAEEYEKFAERSRRMAMSSANKVKQLDKLSKASFDARRSKYLSKDSLFGKARGLGGDFVQYAAGDAVGGAKLKFSLGKGKDASRKKYEDEREKKALDEAKLYDVGGQNEANLSAAGYAARKGMAGKEDTLRYIDKYIDDIDNNKLMTKAEKDARKETARKWRERAQAATKDEELQALITTEKIKNPKVTKLEEQLEEKKAEREALKTKSARKKELEEMQAKGPITTFQEEELKGLENIDEDIKDMDEQMSNIGASIKKVKEDEGDKIDGLKGFEDEAKKYAGGARNAFANVVEVREGNNILQMLNEDYRPRTRQDYSSRVADRIRKGEKNDETKDLLKKAAKAAGIKIEEEHGDEHKGGKKDDHGGGGGGGHAKPSGGGGGAPKPKPAAPSGGGGHDPHGH